MGTTDGSSNNTGARHYAESGVHNINLFATLQARKHLSIEAIKKVNGFIKDILQEDIIKQMIVSLDVASHITMDPLGGDASVEGITQHLITIEEMTDDPLLPETILRSIVNNQFTDLGDSVKKHIIELFGAKLGGIIDKITEYRNKQTEELKTRLTVALKKRIQYNRDRKEELETEYNTELETIKTKYNQIIESGIMEPSKMIQGANIDTIMQATDDQIKRFENYVEILENIWERSESIKSELVPQINELDEAIMNDETLLVGLNNSSSQEESTLYADDGTMGNNTTEGEGITADPTDADTSDEPPTSDDTATSIQGNTGEETEANTHTLYTVFVGNYSKTMEEVAGTSLENIAYNKVVTILNQKDATDDAIRQAVKEFFDSIAASQILQLTDTSEAKNIYYRPVVKKRNWLGISRKSNSPTYTLNPSTPLDEVFARIKITKVQSGPSSVDKTGL